MDLIYIIQKHKKLLDSLQYSPTDMGEERTLDDLKKYSKEEGWNAVTENPNFTS